MQNESSYATPNVRNPCRRKSYSNLCGKMRTVDWNSITSLSEWAKYPGEDNHEHLTQNVVHRAASTRAWPQLNFHHFPVRVPAIFFLFPINLWANSLQLGRIRASQYDPSLQEARIVFFNWFQREKREGKEDRNINDEKESSILCLLHNPYWGLSPKSRQVPWPGTEPITS